MKKDSLLKSFMKKISKFLKKCEKISSHQFNLILMINSLKKKLNRLDSNFRSYFNF